MSLQAGFIGNYVYFSGEDDASESIPQVYVRAVDLDRAPEVALLHGIYTGIVSVALWNIFISKFRSIGGAMVVIIILLYIATTVNFLLNGPFLATTYSRSSRSSNSSAFSLPGIPPPAPIPPVFFDGPSQPEEYPLVSSWGWTPMTDIAIGAAGFMSTAVADCTMIWRCWMVWRWNGIVVLFPILCLMCGLGFKILEIYYQHQFNVEENVNYLVFYLSCILATTLWCTILIVLRIVAVIRENYGAGGKLGEYRHVIEILVESSTLHSAALIIYIVLEVMGSLSSIYFDALAAFTTGIAPTLLVGRVAAGCARPDDSWQGSIMSSLRFETHQRTDADTCSQASCMSNGDLEAQSTQVDELEEIGAEKKRF